MSDVPLLVLSQGLLSYTLHHFSSIIYVIYKIRNEKAAFFLKIQNIFLSPSDNNDTGERFMNKMSIFRNCLDKTIYKW